jgi:excinuclease ABC subunit A
MNEEKEIVVTGARVHNLKNINVTIPRNKLTVITGLSGSGKSSLAFDTIHAEGQRRYLATMSSYARRYIGIPERPDVEQITGLSPVISIEQKTTNRNPRSTVGTVTEIYDFFRLLYAKIGIAYSHVTGEKMVRYSDEQILNMIIERNAHNEISIFAPVIKGRRGHYKDLFERWTKNGMNFVRIDGDIMTLSKGMKLDRYKIHFIDVMIDQLIPETCNAERLKETIAAAMKYGKGTFFTIAVESGAIQGYSQTLMCPTSGISYAEPAPFTFSFNSPQGACTKCNGLGVIPEVDINKIIPNREISIRKGGIAPLGKYRDNIIFAKIDAIAKRYAFSLDDKIKNIPADAMNTLLYGSDETLNIDTINGFSFMGSFDGLLNTLYDTTSTDEGLDSKKIDHYIKYSTCPECGGARLKQESLCFRIADKNIAEIAAMNVNEILNFLSDINDKLTNRQRSIAEDALREINTRLHFLKDVGLSYLSLDRSTLSLSGGESQRIRLATQIGARLVNVLYILDEPSIGLHQRDNMKLIDSLKRLRDAENTVIVVEHDEEMMRAADYIVDIGPFAGVHGGEVIAAGKPFEILRSNSLTAQYLNRRKRIEIPVQRRSGNNKVLVLRGAKGNNLKNITVEFPLGRLICVTGVSGSGKSSLINETLYPILNQYLYHGMKEPLPYESISGLEQIDKVVKVDQTPIGRTPRSNPATYTNVFGNIRKLFEATPEAQIRGYSAGRFSFNVKGGRCEECRGAGMQMVEMSFLPTVYVTCKHCGGQRYNSETLEIRYKEKNIYDVLNMTINEACRFFNNVPNIYRYVKTLDDVGLGYVRLGQSGSTLSGGESQRVKLASELSKRDTGRTFYILDEPTTGLHFEDIRILLEVLNKLVERGNTVLIIEHNLDVIKSADHIIDLGEEGGPNGGQIVAVGTPEKLVDQKFGYTSIYLEKQLKSHCDI